MLHQWANFSSASKPSVSNIETPEQRESRLLTEYESALSSPPESAKLSLNDIASALSQSHQTRLGKRPRQQTPVWERRLRYAVHRNLGDIYNRLSEPNHALSSYIKALDDENTDFLIWLKTARTASQTGHLHIARRAFEVCLFLRPHHWLAQLDYQAVLYAVFDTDDDVSRSNLNDLSSTVSELLVNRTRQLSIEAREANRSSAEHVTFSELSWASLVDTLINCIEQRLSSSQNKGDYNVAHPMVFVFPQHLRPVQHQTNNSTTNKPSTTTDEQNIIEPAHVPNDSETELPVLESQKRQKQRSSNTLQKLLYDEPAATTFVPPIAATDKQQDQDMREEEKLGEQLQIASSDDKPEFSETNAKQEPALMQNEIEEDRSTGAGQPKKPELRRSSRSKAQHETQDEDRRLTRTAMDAKDSTQMDLALIKTLLVIRNNISEGEQSSGIEHCTSEGKRSRCNTDMTRQGVNSIASQRAGQWSTVIDERTEAREVCHFVSSFPERNSGPGDFMLRTLKRLSDIKAVQYSSTLALLWSAMRNKLQFHMPGSAVTTALVIEAMLLSGKKAGKAKEQRFNEAARLLAQMGIDFNIAEESEFLKLRLIWSRTVLCECGGKMQMACSSANEMLVLLQRLENQANSGDFIPDFAGPELSGHTYETLRHFINKRLLRLKRAGDLEKAEVELSKVASGDSEAAIRTVSILAPSVNASIKALDFEKWDESDLAVEFHNSMEYRKWEERLDAEVELEPRLKVFGEACTKASDVVGELVCFSVRLRMAVHYYAAQSRNEARHEENPMGKNSSCEVRLADLLVLIRKYALVIKKIASPTSSSLWNTEEGPCGWSVEKSTSIATVTLIALTKLLITKIPILKISASITELGASQKNRRLGFTRCMLAFVRCYLVNQNCRMPSTQRVDDPASIPTRILTKKRLFAISFCLRALVDRGCCREEGTSGALMKLYSQFLANRLRQLALLSRSGIGKPELRDPDVDTGHMIGKNDSTESKPIDDGTPQMEQDTSVGAAPVEEKTQERTLACPALTGEVPAQSEQTDDTSGQEGFTNRAPEPANSVADEEEEDDTPVNQIDSSYAWKNTNVIRRELAQCYQCLYQIPDLELTSSYSQGSPIDLWLEEGCRVSKHIGLQFTSGEPMNVVPVIDAEACCNIYLFYRKRIFEAIGHRRRDGGRGKRLREVLSRLAESLPESPPNGVQLLPFKALNNIVMDVISSQGDISRGAAENVTRLEEEWSRGGCNKKSVLESPFCGNYDAQLSILYFEVFTLHALSTMGTHELEYKKQKSAERRKSPKEVAERLISAYSDCLIALRSRPWSVGAWILLGRMFVETADLALDERELSLSSFGLYRPGDLATFDEKITSISAIFGRAEASFAFAESLLRHTWAKNACNRLIPVDSAVVLGQAFQANESWDGFGDDGDLFGWFGLTNSTTSRPRFLNESHPNQGKNDIDQQRLAAIRFGCSALSILRLRELRYFHTHWTHNTIETKLLTHPRNRFPTHIVQLSTVALTQLREAKRLASMDQGGTTSSADEGMDTAHQLNEDPVVFNRNGGSEIQGPEKSECVALSKNLWYYLLLEAKLMRKEGQPAKEYLPVFQKAVEENRRLRESLRQPWDIEPIYKLHAARMKILRTTDDNASAIEVLALLEKYNFSTQQRPIVLDEAQRKDDEDWIIERKIALAEDIILAMQFCSNPKSEMVYSEFFFKSKFCKAILLVEVLKDTRTAMQEIDKLFGIESALRTLDQGPDGTYRGYFYRMWNYHYTDTGIEPALESERKLVRWRGKMLGLYGQLLKNMGEWRLLAAIIYRLKKRNSEDLPVDGALLDDLIDAYSVTSRLSILTSMEKSIVTDTSAFEASYRRTWDIYTESLRLAQGMKRVALSLNRGELNETGGERLIASGRPRCLVAVHTALRLEHIRWKSALEHTPIDLNTMRMLPISGSMTSIPVSSRHGYLETLHESADKWPLEEKMGKLLVRRMTELSPETDVATTDQVPNSLN